MNAAGSSSQQQLCFSFDCQVTPRGDGSYVLRPGKPRVESPMMTIRELMKVSGLQKSQARQLALELGANQRRPNCKLFVDRDAVMRHLSRKAGGTT